MPKSVASIFLLFALLLSNFSRIFICASFNLNQKYIASTLCENRDKPELHCNGKCYLKKKLKQAEEKEQKQERQSQQLQLQYTMSVNQVVFQDYSVASTNFSVPLSTGMPIDIKNSIFHPPQIS